MDEVGGIRRPLCCPRCGTLNALGVAICRVCKIDLTPVDRLPPEALTHHCPHCLSDNPRPADLNLAAFCIHCGREIHFPGQSRLIGLTDLAATPGADVCPRCRQKCSSLAEIHAETPATWLTRQLVPPSRPWILLLGGRGLRAYRDRKQREYRAALDRWSRAHFCSTDAIVFVRRATTVSASPLRGIRHWLWAGVDA
jgi:NMD protein affecting ribosome stability and mRNA decay